MRPALFACLAALPLAGCSTTAPEIATDGPVREAAMRCDASDLQSHIGHTVSAEMGQAVLEASGARSLRWIPPRTAVTMDYREDRLNVAYGDNMAAERIYCG